MNLMDFQFVGPPCGQHGPYTFYKGFSCKKNGRSRNIALGEFFFLRISPADQVCIGELQLLWEDRNNQLVLTSSRLYYLPENTPCGRHGHHGQDEVLAVSTKAVLRLEDLVDWMVDDVQWDRGLPGLLEETNVPDKDALVEAFTENNMEVEDLKNGRLRETKGPPSLSILSYPRYCRYRAILKRLENVTDEWVKNTLVKALGGFTFPSRNHRVLFCRDTFDHPTLETHHSLVNYLAPNLKGRPRKKRLKGRRGQSPSSESNASEESKDYRETPRLNKVRIEIYRSNGMKKCRLEETCGEQEFLQKLFKFMQERNTPIERVPHLGFKQINLFLFYTYAQKLGGYEKITIKKLWKQIYDELGGNPGSTSAATCTRRHYERLLLPYERFTKGEEDKPLPPPVKHRRASTTLKNKKRIEMQSNENKNSVNDVTTITIKTLSAISNPTAHPISSSPTENPDRKSLSPSLTPNPPPTSVTPLGDMELPDLDSPEPLSPSPPSPPTLTVSIPSPVSPSQSTINERTPSPLPSIDTKPLEVATEVRPDPELRTKEQEWEERKRKLPQPRKRLRDDRYSEKERQWDEIRRQNALERDRVKQLSAVARTSGRLMKLRDHLSENEGTIPSSPDSPKSNSDNGAMQQLQQSVTPVCSSPPNLALSVTEGSSQDSKDVFLSASPAPENLPPPPPLLDLTRTVNTMVTPNSEKESKSVSITILRKSPEQNSSSSSSSSEAQDLSVVKSIKVENEENQKPQEICSLMKIPSPNLSRRTSFSVPSAAGGYVTLHPVLSSKINSVNHHHHHHNHHPSKVSSELTIKIEPEAKASSSIPRPSVIQHTQKACHSLTSTPSPVSLSVSPLPVGNNTSFMRKSLDSNSTTPTKPLSDNELSSHNNTNIHSSQYYPHRFYSYSNQLVTNVQTHMEPLKRSYIEPPIVSAPKYYPAPRVYGQPMAYRGSPYVNHLFQVSNESENGEVLDLRVSKNKTEEKVEKLDSKAPYTFWEYESITPPDRELDLSVKNKSTPPLNDQTLNSSSHNSHQFNSHNNMISQKEPLEQAKGASTSKMVTVTPVVRSDDRQTGTREPVLIEQADTPDSKGSTKPATPHSSASQSAQAYAYLPPGGKSSYYSDYPNHFPPGLYSSSLYGFSTQFLTSSSRPALPEQLQASLAVYKDMVQRGYYPPGYPYPIPSQFYPQVYKEGQQYIYPPK